MTSEQAMERYEALGLVRSGENPSVHEFVANTATERVRFVYQRRHGEAQWKFVNVVLELPADTGTRARELYEQLAVLVTSRLGKPRQVLERPPYFGQTFALGAQLEVSVGAVTAQEPRPYAALTIVVPRRK